jgi:hypothetical protein
VLALCAAGVFTLSVGACTEESPAGENTGGGNGIGGFPSGGSGNMDAGNAGSSNAGSSAGGTSSDAGDAGACVYDEAAAMGCADDGDAIDIAGEYDDGFGGTVSIEDCAIYGSPVSSVDNDEQYFVLQNSCDDMFNPGKWSRYEWTWVTGDAGEPELYLCTSVYDADSEAEAIAADRADDSDPANDGCSGFPWSKLNPLSAGDAGADAG